MHPPSVTGLSWSIRGEVACDNHTPDTDDRRWMVEGWAPVPVSSGDMKTSRYQCQHCAGDGTAIIHPSTRLLH
jgi:hypothetical protein